ncbi:MAG: YaeQ family protein, partial [Nitrospirae bacterium]|nr:YaeQ family protein [Nitrospirota bacterium]
WIEVGQPDEKSVRQACGRAKQVVIYTYGGHKADRWWDHSKASLERTKNLTVINVSSDTTSALAALARRDLHLNYTVQDGDMVIGDGEKTVQVAMTTLKEAQAL